MPPALPRKDCLLCACEGDLRCRGEGGGIPPTCVRASSKTPIPPASPADAARFNGEQGVCVGTLHCARSLFPVDSGALWILPYAFLGFCDALPPQITRSNLPPRVGSPLHEHRSNGTFTTEINTRKCQNCVGTQGGGIWEI
jgi:hypothetical protein